MMAGAVGVVFVLLAIHVLHSESITVHICEGQSRSISCNAGQKMRIDRAIYGRESRGICSAHNTGNTNCRSGSASAIIRNRCQNRRSCSLHSTNGWFGDPCHGIYKYIEVRYTCITIDPCLTSYVRESNWQRSIKYNGSLNTPHHCDTAVANRWFRFTSKAGTHMPTSCPKPYACGTEGPIWLNGAYPTQDGQQIGVAVCARKKDNCCARSWSINIRKCRVGSDSFFLHRLSAAPECPMSYCAGTEIPCPPGYNSKTGYTPGCTKQYPAFTNVRMSHGVRERRLEFICEFSSNDVNETSDIFEVTWWQGAPAEQIKKTDYLRGTQRKAILRNTHKYPETPLYYLGTTISCQVRSWFEHANHTTSKFVESNHFFAGIQVLPPQLKFRISEGDKPMKLMIRNTVPIVCELFKCFVIIELGQTSSDSLLDVCSVQFEPGKANQTKEIQVVALRDFVDDGDHTMFVKFHVFDHVDPVDWNMHKKIPDVQIMSMDVGTERCTTTGDPHLTTFDKFYFHHYQVGDYVLVQSKCRKFEVHVRTWKCASVSCNCGVAAREGDDVVVVDMCRDRIPRARFASTVEPHPDTKLTRDRNGKSFEIAFPSGAFVRIDLHRWYGNLWYGNIQVQVVSDDFKCTEGLCGTFDRNKNNELKTRGGQVIPGRNGAVAPTQFTESWKIPTGRSLFYYRGGPRKCKAKRVKHFCTCEERCCGKRQVNCDFKGYAKRPKYKKGKKTWKDLNFPGGKHCGRRKRRSTSDTIILPDDEGDLTDYIYDPAPIAVVTPTWPTPLGKTLAATRKLCSTRIQNSEITKVCTKELDAFDVAPFIEECITDIQVSDNNTFIMSAIEKMKHHCEEKTLKDISRWQKDPTKNNTLEPPEIIDNIICPNQCSGNGRCVNATCVCDAGFKTADCSMKVGEGPVVISKWPTQLDGLCDLRKRECSRARVSGINFIDSDQLKCRGVPAEYKDNTFEKSKGSEISRGYLLSFAEVMCELDKLPTNVDRYATGEKGRAVAGLFIDVANNGQNYSESQALYIVYDSKCMNCSLNETTCQQKDGTCLINGFCFNQGQVNPHDYCQICDPVRDMSKFSIREAHAKPIFHTKSDWTAFRGQDFKMQIEASDPENQTVSLSLYENYEGVSLFKNGTFKWKPLEVKMNLFKIIAEDRCGKKSSLTLNINATECTCGEKQTCELVKNGTKDILNCLCPDGCTGPMCSEPLPGKSCAFVDRPGRAVGGDNKSKTVIISVSIGVAVLVILTAVISYCVIVRKRRQTTKKEIEKSIVYNKSEAQAKVFENDMYASTAQLT